MFGYIAYADKKVRIRSDGYIMDKFRFEKNYEKLDHKYIGR